MSYYDGDGDYIIYEDANGSHDSDEADSGEYSYPEDEDDLEFVHHEDDDGDSDGNENEEDGEVEGEIGNAYRNSRSGDHADRISFLQDIVSRLADQRTGEAAEGGVEEGEEADSERASGRSLPDLLQELGRSEGFFGASRGNSRYHKLIENVMQAEDDPYIAMESLRELSEQLLMLNPLIADRIIPAGKLMDALVHVLSSPLLQAELELQLTACICLYNYYEMNPEMIQVSVKRDIIEILKLKLNEISYIDLAEQVLETLEFISRVHGTKILRSGTLLSCLQYLDFFTVHAQKKALSIVANSCARAKEDDFEMVSEIFPVLKQIFLNNTNSVILKPVLITLYSISGSLNKDSLSKLFDIDLVKRLLSLLSSEDLERESVLKLLGILSLLVSTNVELSKQILLDCELYKVIQNVFHPYKKSSTSAFSETLIYVPKDLLLSVTTFILLLLPTEDGQMLTAGEAKIFTFDDSKDKFIELSNQLIPCLVEIYFNTLGTRIRYTVLAALARVFSSLPHGFDVPSSSVINLISSGLISGSNAPEADLKSENGAILVALFSLVSIMMSSASDVYLPKFRKEGIPDAITSLKSRCDNEFSMKDSVEQIDDSTVETEKSKQDPVTENSSSFPVFGSDSELDDDDDEESKDSYRMEYDDMNIPEYVKPRRIQINVYGHLNPYLIMKNLSMFSSMLLELFSSNQDEVTNELSEINAIVLKMKEVDVKSDSEQYWVDFWTGVKSKLFNDVANISGFELISTGLIDSMANIFESDSTRQSLSKKSFRKVFGDKLPEFVELLQHALSSTETFAILDAGTVGNDSPSTSLIKQMKIRLVYDVSDDAAANDTIPKNLQDIVIAIHCVASLKTLDEFLKHKIAQSEFLSSIIPVTNRPTQQHNPANVVKDLDKIQFDFSLNGYPLDQTSTIYSVIFKEAMRDNSPTSSIWSSVPTFKYKKSPKRNDLRHLHVIYPDTAFEGADLKPVNGILSVIESSQHPSLSASAYINPKISAKLSRQLEEPLIVACGVLPSWVLDITRNYGFLFPFETRMHFLQNTSYGYGRLIQYWRDKLTNQHNNSSTEYSLHQLGRLTRHKLRVSRDSLFLSGIKILEKYGSSTNVLEIEYKDEEGTGLGPTLEFYSLMSKEFADKSLNMWRTNGDTDDIVNNYITGTLFPGPLLGSTDEENEKIIKLFENLGTLVARSMLDNRILDFRFNPLFFELMHKQCRDEQIDLEDLDTCLDLVGKLDVQLGRSLSFLYNNRHNDSLKDLNLFFMLPGYNIELLEGGSRIMVEPFNVQEYLIRVFDQLLGKGIERQLTAFRDGFSKSFSYSSLLILNPAELSDLFGAVAEDWSVQTLYSFIHADHGYSMDSPIITYLIDILSNFSTEEKRLFLQFITGSPKLPLGGFKNLKPKFTVVLKHPDGNISPNHCLPSVMTCANYLKLPKYSDKSVLRDRLVHAMTEGSGAFLLS
ncbi:unnamed protein product [Kluyveromyces dobzhanskii CBS 2104]|uniref:HECT-type E3 ubiquitin transferase n=1 Tax=Kluyveromyces dobzhanskii CBS 2104 TaxID=1427455 RepID=A0A0A8LAL3_9SACH|nr:unnamed protein product [Kluyveromyces dobzhanskii CBS 2104]